MSNCQNKKTDGLSSIPLTSELSDCAWSVSTDQMTSETLQWCALTKPVLFFRQVRSSTRPWHLLKHDRHKKKNALDIVLKCFVLMMFLVEAIKIYIYIYCNWKHGTLKVENILNVADCHVASTNWLQNCLTVKHAYSTHMHCVTKNLHASKTQNCVVKTKTSSHNRFDLYCVAHLFQILSCRHKSKSEHIVHFLACNDTLKQISLALDKDVKL